jgi:hypothetical protein
MARARLTVEPLVTVELEDTTALPVRARRPAVLACALSAAVLAPLVDWLLLEGVLTNHQDPPLGHVLTYATWTPLLAGVLGGLVAFVSLRLPTSARARLASTIGLGTVSGVLQLALLFLASVPAEVVDRGVAALEVIVFACVFGTMGSIVNAPMGAVFGMLFVIATGPALWCEVRPSHDGPAWCWLSGASLLALATGLALGLLLALEGPYCQALFVVTLPSLGVALPLGSDLAWTRYLLAAPLALGAFAFALRGLWLHAALLRCAIALREDCHPPWKITTEPASETVVPLFALDRLRDTVVIVTRDAPGPYRAHPRPVAAIADRRSRAA